MFKYKGNPDYIIEVDDRPNTRYSKGAIMSLDKPDNNTCFHTLVG